MTVKKKLEKLKAKDISKIIEKKEESQKQESITAVPNIYDNSALFKREAVEQRLEKYKELFLDQEEGAAAAGQPEEPPKSWIQIKAAAMSSRKNGGMRATNKTKNSSKSKKTSKASIHPQNTLAKSKIAEEAKKGEGDVSPTKRQNSDDPLNNKTEAPDDTDENNKGSRNINLDPTGGADTADPPTERASGFGIRQEDGSQPQKSKILKKKKTLRKK